MIFKFNVLSTHIYAKQWRLQGSVNIHLNHHESYHRHLTETAKSAVVVVVSVVNETYVE